MNDSIAIKDIIILGVGIAGGYAISNFFHNKQNKSSDDNHADVIRSLDKILEQTLRNGVKNSNVIHSIKSIKNEVENLSDLIEIKEQMDISFSTITSIQKGEDPQFEDVFRYKTLGDKWSELVSTQLDLKILETNGYITNKRLFSVHKSIFPEGFPWAGKYRDKHVYVVDNYGTTPRIIDAVQAEIKTETIAPESIDNNLNLLFNHWNENVTNLIDREPIIKVNETAKFHHEFELIHPFLDGNGRIGRMLLEEQLSLLFQTKITFRPDRDDYYQAIRLMNMGEANQLSDLIIVEIKKFNIAL